MNYIKHFEEFGEGAYPGPPIVNQASSFLTAGASDGMIGGGPGFGMTGAMGGEFPKKYAPPKGSTHDKFRQNVTQTGKKDSKQRKDAIKKLDKLAKVMSFDDFQKEKEEKK